MIDFLPRIDSLYNLPYNPSDWFTLTTCSNDLNLFTILFHYPFKLMANYTSYIYCPFLILSSVTCYSQVHSHPLDQLHFYCLKALDYPGCMAHESNSNSQSNQPPPNHENWRSYGPIKVHWTRWKSQGDYHIAPILNSNSKQSYIAINCKSRQLNITNHYKEWKGWLPANQSFENRIIFDFCSN